MKKILLGALILGAFASCKKDKNDPTCEKTVAGIAGSYKLTKFESVAGSQTSDETSNFFTDCERNAVMTLKSDKTMTYTESGGSCNGNSSGTWDVVNGNITINSGAFIFSGTPITTWDCSELVISETQTTAGITVGARTHFKKQ